MKPDESEVLVITDSSEKAYEIYPTDRPELFHTAVALNHDISITEDYGVMDYTLTHYLTHVCVDHALKR